MGQPVFLVRNFFSRRIYPLHILAASAASGAGEIVGNEFGRIGDACRDPFDYWTNETANTEVRGVVTCDRSRSADMLAIDRAHNLAGKQVLCEVADVSDFSSLQVACDCTLPTVTGTGDLDDLNGIRTEEGAWLKRFPVRSGKYWRLRIPAMGASLKPQIVNAWLDLSWSPTLLDTPLAPDSHEIGGQASTTQSGWEIRSGIWVRRMGHVGMRLLVPSDYELARDQIQYQFGLNRPMWIIHDDEQADRAVLALPRLGKIEIEQKGRGWFYPRVDFDWIEHSAKDAA